MIVKGTSSWGLQTSMIYAKLLEEPNAFEFKKKLRSLLGQEDPECQE